MIGFSDLILEESNMISNILEDTLEAFIGDLYEEGYISFHQELGTWEETSGYSI